MALASIAVLIGLVLLVWSAGRFVEGAANIARHLRMPPLLIGMVVVGFGTSAPELIVSALSAAQGNPDIALGNAYGSNIANIGLILGLTALVSPIVVQSAVLRRELPLLASVTALSAWLLWNGQLSRVEAVALLVVFGGLMVWTVWQGIRTRDDALQGDVSSRMRASAIPVRVALRWLVAGLIILLASSRALVWGAVRIATGIGVSDLVIGLTVVAIGTSLPELASSLIAARKGEHDLAVGNVVGSNLFNTLAVVGLAGVIRPMHSGLEILARDVLTVGAMTVFLFLIGYGFRKPGRINRLEGAALLAGYVAYMTYLLMYSALV